MIEGAILILISLFVLFAGIFTLSKHSIKFKFNNRSRHPGKTCSVFSAMPISTNTTLQSAAALPVVLQRYPGSVDSRKLKINLWDYLYQFQLGSPQDLLRRILWTSPKDLHGNLRSAESQ